jgi:uncharacterized protein YihD (DUF1040 family)
MAMSGERDPARIDGLLSAIGAAWRANPELRLLAGLNAIADGPGYLGGDE